MCMYNVVGTSTVVFALQKDMRMELFAAQLLQIVLLCVSGICILRPLSLKLKVVLKYWQLFIFKIYKWYH